MNLLDMFCKEDVEKIKHVCELFRASYIWIDKKRYTLPNARTTSPQQSPKAFKA